MTSPLFNVTPVFRPDLVACDRPPTTVFLDYDPVFESPSDGCGSGPGESCDDEAVSHPGDF